MDCGKQHDIVDVVRTSNEEDVFGDEMTVDDRRPAEEQISNWTTFWLKDCIVVDNEREDLIVACSDHLSRNQRLGDGLALVSWEMKVIQRYNRQKFS